MWWNCFKSLTHLFSLYLLTLDFFSGIETDHSVLLSKRSGITMENGENLVLTWVSKLRMLRKKKDLLYRQTAWERKNPKLEEQGLSPHPWDRSDSTSQKVQGEGEIKWRGWKLVRSRITKNLRKPGSLEWNLYL